MASDAPSYRRIGTAQPETVVHTDSAGNVVGKAVTSAVLYECETCGALVIMQPLHTAWHQEQTDASTTAVRRQKAVGRDG